MTFGLTHEHQAKPLLALLVDGSSSGTIAQSLRAQAFRVDVVASLGQLTARSYHPRPDAVIVVNNLPDGSWLAAVLAARARWRSSIVVVGGTGTTPLSLTAHQLDVLRCLGSGKTTDKEIAAELRVSPLAVRSAVARLTEDLGLRRAQLSAFAVSLGLVAAEALHRRGHDDHG